MGEGVANQIPISSRLLGRSGGLLDKVGEESHGITRGTDTGRQLLQGAS